MWSPFPNGWSMALFYPHGYPPFNLAVANLSPSTFASMICLHQSSWSLVPSVFPRVAQVVRDAVLRDIETKAEHMAQAL